MLGLSFASVPLYRVFCQATGVGGTTQRATTAPSKAAAASITIRFEADTAPDLGWEFQPLQSTLTVHPGEEKKAFYRAINKTAGPVTLRRSILITWLIPVRGRSSVRSPPGF